MVWLIAGQEQIEARDQIAGFIERNWGVRIELRAQEMADGVVAFLYANGFRVIREAPVPLGLLVADKARLAMTDVLSAGVEQVLDWETFKHSTDEDIARRLTEWAMSDDCDYEFLVRERHV